MKYCVQAWTQEHTYTTHTHLMHTYMLKAESSIFYKSDFRPPPPLLRSAYALACMHTFASVCVCVCVCMCVHPALYLQ